MRLIRFNNLMPVRLITYLMIITISMTSIYAQQKESFILVGILFILLVINSTIRVKLLEYRTIPFFITLIIEAIIFTIIYKKVDAIIVVIVISIIDVVLFLKPKLAIVAVISINAVLFYNMWSINPQADLSYLIGNYVGNLTAMFFFACAAYLIRTQDKLRRELQTLYEELKVSKENLEEKNLKLIEYADTIEQVAILNERNRLAGEIHDTIGHALTGLIMEIDLCDKLVIKDTQLCKVELKKASILARETLAQVRESVKAIKADESSRAGIEAIESLIKEFMANTKITVHAAISKQQYHLPPTTEVTLYRMVQEALTNCARHGQAKKVVLQMDFKDRGILMYIKDDGVGCAAIHKGMGLQSMEERVKALGGHIDFSSNEGFIIEAFIPMEVA